ncbi:quinol:cytochrome C oxidoreductase [Flavicella sp.]|uniref:quinol:cytochrome C oxidoreductase n=1 Tax=Flavicella sp. TaxID=2957742 RepID=UPI003018DA26
MYQFSGKLKTIALALMVLGAVGVISGFLTTPSSIEEVKEHLHHEENAQGAHDKNVVSHHDETKQEAHGHSEGTHEVVADGEKDHGDSHAEHVYHQLKNRPWAAFYVACFFFFGITLLVLAFYAIQRVSQAGWPIVLYRVMEGITGNLLPVTIILLIILLLGSAHVHHLFIWMEPGTVDPTSDNYDALIEGKSWWLNIPGWTIRSIVYITGWNLYRHLSRKASLAEDNETNLVSYNKNFKMSVAFLGFFLVTESMMSWDWIMSLDPHWFSSLFAWYILATFMVSAVTVIAMVTIYLKSKGHLEYVNDSHIHDLAKYMFGFSIFWTYLWFSQFMLIWYANMPEETTYFIQRFEEYKLPFLIMIPMNFVFPILLLINSDYKRIPNIVIGTGLVVLLGHYTDVFIMIMPATVGGEWFFGIPEISAIVFFLGLFIYSVFSSIAKAPLLAKGNPFLKESEKFHY